LETMDRAILIKEYAGYAVAVQVPKKTAAPPPTSPPLQEGAEGPHIASSGTTTENHNTNP
jgi:hypothetical protein